MTEVRAKRALVTGAWPAEDVKRDPHDELMARLHEALIGAQPAYHRHVIPRHSGAWAWHAPAASPQSRRPSITVQRHGSTFAIIVTVERQPHDYLADWAEFIGRGTTDDVFFGSRGVAVDVRDLAFEKAFLVGGTGEAPKPSAKEPLVRLFKHLAGATLEAHEEAPAHSEPTSATDDGELTTPEAEAVHAELGDAKWNFRTVRGLAARTGLSQESVQRYLEANPELVRWVPAFDDQGNVLLVDAARPVSTRERLIHLRAYLTKTIR